MTDRWTAYDDEQLGELLASAGQQGTFPETPDLVSSVRERIGPPPDAELPWYRRVWGSLQQRPAYASAAVAVLALVLAIGVFTPVPGAVADRLGVSGIDISLGPLDTSPAPLGSDLNLGERVSLGEAESSVAYEIAVPNHPGLGEPDEVYVGDLGEVQQVSLVYSGGDDIPTVRDDVGLLVTHIPAQLDGPVIRKGASEGTTVENISVGDHRGFWLSGEPHTFGYQDSSDDFRQEDVRLASHVLLWETDDMVYRIEGALSKDDALAIAESMVEE